MNISADPPKYRRRLVRVAPVIPFPSRTVQMVNGVEYVAEVGPPRGFPPDVRANQTLALRRHGSDLTLLGYAEIKDALAAVDQDEHQDMDPQMRAVLTGFLAAVNTAIPYDVQNLSNDVGILRIAEVCRLGNDRSVNDRLCHRTEWSADDLLLLKLEFPELDLEATLRRHGFWRALRKTGRWAEKGIPPVLREYGRMQHWETAEGDE